MSPANTHTRSFSQFAEVDECLKKVWRIEMEDFERLYAACSTSSAAADDTQHEDLERQLAATQLELSNVSARSTTELEQVNEQLAAAQLELSNVSARNTTELEQVNEQLAATQLELSNVSARNMELEQVNEQLAAAQLEESRVQSTLNADREGAISALQQQLATTQIELASATAKTAEEAAAAATAAEEAMKAAEEKAAAVATAAEEAAAAVKAAEAAAAAAAAAKLTEQVAVELSTPSKSEQQAKSAEADPFEMLLRSVEQAQRDVDDVLSEQGKGSVSLGAIEEQLARAELEASREAEVLHLDLCSLGLIRCHSDSVR